MGGVDEDGAAFAGGELLPGGLVGAAGGDGSGGAEAGEKDGGIGGILREGDDFSEGAEGEIEVLEVGGIVGGAGAGLLVDGVGGAPEASVVAEIEYRIGYRLAEGEGVLGGGAYSNSG